MRESLDPPPPPSSPKAPGVTEQCVTSAARAGEGHSTPRAPLPLGEHAAGEGVLPNTGGMEAWSSAPPDPCTGEQPGAGGGGLNGQLVPDRGAHPAEAGTARPEPLTFRLVRETGACSLRPMDFGGVLWHY